MLTRGFPQENKTARKKPTCQDRAAAATVTKTTTMHYRHLHPRITQLSISHISSMAAVLIITHHMQYTTRHPLPASTCSDCPTTALLASASTLTAHFRNCSPLLQQTVHRIYRLRWTTQQTVAQVRQQPRWISITPGYQQVVAKAHIQPCPALRPHSARRSRSKQGASLVMEERLDKTGSTSSQIAQTRSLL